ncbi:hypothetical protein [Cryobacterium psychrophilum]|uniref:Alpha/beta hydrolase n=1 Tax=Cryobacterium psychrophilum TaxID=41988 RepID=A0A4Y8KMB8_9MICO|nr:hypothetical protein [Cryobacterium psychrophilum]TDW30167.1 hypothetical protein EDD25_1910 [Cryobacterium psychrophilum]TFD77397.1 hypothetical protein E3T53_11260 [Cryobacterium psychrophilum]
MSDGDLVLSGGGTVMVETDTVFAQMQLMRRVQAEANGWQARLARICELQTSPAPQWVHGTVGAAVMRAEGAVESIQGDSGDLADRLARAAEAYGLVERGRANVGRIVGEEIGWRLGAALGQLPPVQMLLLWAAAIVAGGLAVQSVGVLVNGGPRFTKVGEDPRPRPPASAPTVRLDPRLLTSTAFVSALRVVMSSLDDVQAGALHMPLALSRLLGEGGAGVRGTKSVAREAVMAGSSVGVLQNSPVIVTRWGGAVPVLAPDTLEEVAARIPKAEADRPQVRIEKYGDPQHPAWGVYVPGTVEWSPVTATEPWDITSNLQAVAGGQPASAQAVALAMRQAGIRPGDPVIFAGHSQGGAVVQLIAADEEFNAKAVVTFGAPEGNVPVPQGVSEVAVEHTNDLVPALTGMGGVGGAESVGDRLIVRREAFHNEPIPTDEPLPAHSMSAYTDTARAMDRSTESRLTGFATLLTTTLGAGLGAGTGLGAGAGSGAGASSGAGSVTRWKGERLVPSPVGRAR